MRQALSPAGRPLQRNKIKGCLPEIGKLSYTSLGAVKLAVSSRCGRERVPQTRNKKDVDGAQLAASLVSYALGIRYDAIMSSGRGTPSVSLARQIAMYLTYAGLGMSQSRVAFAFERDRSTVGHACRLIEDRRDDPDFDAWLEQLETGLVSVLPAYGRQVA